MEEGDTVIFGYLDDDLTESDPMTSKDAVNTAADTIDYNEEKRLKIQYPAEDINYH